jgi:hypothetical protein
MPPSGRKAVVLVGDRAEAGDIEVVGLLVQLGC